MADNNNSQCLPIALAGSEVVDFSSQYGHESRLSYSAQNLAGPFNIYPHYGDFTQACVFRTYGKWWRKAPCSESSSWNSLTTMVYDDFVEVLFQESVYPLSVLIFETYNPGAVARILAAEHQTGTCVDSGAKIEWSVLWSSPVVHTPQASRVFSPPIKKLDRTVNLIRLELNHSLLSYYTELDSILLCGTRCRPSPSDYPTLMKNTEKSINEFWGKSQGCYINYQGIDTLSTSDLCIVQEDTCTCPIEHNELAEENACFDAISRINIDTDIHIFERLPEEVVLLILSILDLTSLCRVAQTCRFMRTHAYEHLLYAEVDLQSIWSTVTAQALKCLSSRCSSMQRLNLSWCGKANTIDNCSLSIILCSSKCLTCLRLSCCSFISVETLSLIASLCSTLIELDVSGCKGVDSAAHTVFLMLPSVQSLNLYRTMVDTGCVIAIARTMSNLRHLNVGSCRMIDNMPLVLHHLGVNCHDLLSLDLWRTGGLNDASFQTFVETCSQLEELDIGWCSELFSNEGTFVCIATSCPNLKKLFVTANRTVSDHDVLTLAHCCPLLQQLDILGTADVTRSALEVLLQKCTHMVLLDVSFCAAISEQVIADLRAEFPSVDIKKSFQYTPI